VSEESNVIVAHFGEEMYQTVFNMLKMAGRAKTEQIMLESGNHPSYVKAVIKKIMRERGW
jgi:hypothetical protein